MNQISKKISIILPNLNPGGAERIALYLANDWVRLGYIVEMVLMEKKGEFISLLNPEVLIIDLKSIRIRNTVKSLKDYFKVSKPDVIFVGMWPLTSASILAWIFSRKIGSIYLIDHNQLSISIVKELNLSSFILKFFLKITYPLATGIMAVSNGVKSDLCQLGGFSEHKVKVIYNPASTGIPSSTSVNEIEKKRIWGENFQFNILSVGGLHPQKNHIMLIKAFSKISRKLNAKLIILGEGKLRVELEALIKELNLEDCVDLPGFIKNPYPWYLTADLFVLSSNWEGLPTVLIESLECGLPIISTDCPSGPDEILENGRYGKLVPMNDVDALSKAIEYSFSEEHDKALLIKRANDFTIENISHQYLSYFGLEVSK
jgi:glycosyltransferase involved in cell wall biosynthesis